MAQTAKSNWGGLKWSALPPRFPPTRAFWCCTLRSRMVICHPRSVGWRDGEKACVRVQGWSWSCVTFRGPGMLKLRRHADCRTLLGEAAGNESNRSRPIRGDASARAPLRRCGLSRSQRRGPRLSTSVCGARHLVPPLLGKGESVPAGPRQRTTVSRALAAV